MSDETTPVTPPSAAARLRPRKIRSHNKDVSLSEGDVNLESLDEVKSTGESTVNISNKVSHNTPHSSPRVPLDVQNGSISAESCDTGCTVASTPSPSVGRMPIWKLEIKIKEAILKAAVEKPGHAYIFADPADEAGYFKLGRSGTPLTREKKHQDNCRPSFELIGVVPRAHSIPWSRRLELLAQAELTNMRCSFDCPCSTSHKEYFTGRACEGLEILNCWSSWLQLSPSPYDEGFQLSPFWRDRLRLLGGNAFSHFRCFSTKCRSTRDIASSSCQACLRLRLQAWTDVTDFDYFKYECGMRVGWTFLREVMSFVYSMWPHIGNRLLILVDGWEKIKFLATCMWDPVIQLHLLLLLVLCLSRVPPETINSIVCYAIACPLSYWRIMQQMINTPGYSQFGKDQIIPRPSTEKANRSASNSPEPMTLPEIVSEPAAPHEREKPSKKRSVSVHEHTNDSRIPQGHKSATAAGEMSEALVTEHNTPEPFLTPDRATTTVSKRSPRASAKRRKSDVL